MNSNELALTKIRQELDIQSEFQRQKRQLGIQFPHQLMGRKYQEWLKRFTPEEQQLAAARLKSVSSGFYSVLPIVCKGAQQCPHGHICPFIPKEPLGLQCPMEQQIIVERMHQFMREYQIDGQRPTDFMLLNRLVELELTDFRCSSMLSSSQYQGVLREVTTGSTPQGDLITNEIINPIMEMKEKISREKMKLLSVLVGTPQEKYKKQAALKEVKTEEYSNKISGMNKQLMDLEKKLLAASNETGD
jgi:hypothetical protein